MKTWIGLAGLIAAMAAGAAWAADPAAQYKPEDVIKAYNGAATASCAPGTVAGADGGCDPVVHTRGFSLATPGAKAAAAKPAPSAGAHKPTLYKASAPLTADARPGDLLITFNLGSSELTAQARANAHAFAVALNSPQLSAARFGIGGHTDASGSPERNMVLSTERAQAVKAYLVTQGVDGARLEAKGYGSERLADPAHPDAATNRRVEALRLN
jgi:outer membrane protein OmpA-like peptidoglycan-associated protein